MGVTRIALLGSTGSIGRQTLDVVAAHPERFAVVALAAGQNHQLLAEQAARFRPSLVAAETAPETPAPLPAGVELVTGPDSLLAAATCPGADVVVVATSGHSAILPTLRAIQAGKTIALANKETIVCAGELIMAAARAHGVTIRPVDSEHGAVWQCLQGAPADGAPHVTITASGGPFLRTPLDELHGVTVEQALAHPNWSMGSKVTIDSATMMNKGLEVIEAHWLFDLPYERIGVLIQPQSVVHALVSFADGSTVAQLAAPDMRLPIQYALTYPERLPSPAPPLDLARLGTLEFLEPDPERFPALGLARRAGEAGSTYPTVLSGADEVAVAAFLAGRLRFSQIVEVVTTVVERHQSSGSLTLEAIEAADAWAHEEAAQEIAARTGVQ